MISTAHWISAGQNDLACPDSRQMIVGSALERITAPQAMARGSGSLLRNAIQDRA